MSRLEILKLVAKIAVHEEKSYSTFTNPGEVPAILVEANT